MRDVVYLTRHGARIDTEDSRWLSKCDHNRRDDPHLSSNGKVGAHELARKMKKLQQEDGWETLHIVSSPYIRCIETANEVATVLNTTIKVEPGIGEVNSSQNPGFLDTTKLKEQFPSIDTTYKPALNRVDLTLEYSDGACAQRSGKSAKSVMEHLRGDYPVLFVGHGASCLGIAGEFGRRGYVGYTSLSKFVCYEERSWKCMKFGDVSHLSDKQTSLDSAW